MHYESVWDVEYIVPHILFNRKNILFVSSKTYKYKKIYFPF